MKMVAFAVGSEKFRDGSLFGITKEIGGKDMSEVAKTIKAELAKAKTDKRRTVVERAWPRVATIDLFDGEKERVHLIEEHSPTEATYESRGGTRIHVKRGVKNLDPE